MSENSIWNDYVKRIERERRRERHNAWLVAHPVASWVFACLFALGVLAAAIVLRALLCGWCEPLNR